jgi:hypothetical protein
MAIGPDGRIIRRRVRFLTPVNTNNPSENTGFFLGLISVLILPILVVFAFMLLGWLGGLIFDFEWLNTKNFITAGFFVNLLVFPVYISGVLEGLARTRYGRYKFYAFVYGVIAMSILVFLSTLSKTEPNYYNYLYALAYGFYSMYFAGKMAR